MPAITIRSLPDSVHASLKQQAAAGKQSVEALVRRILATEMTMENTIEASSKAPGFSEAPLSWPHAPASSANQAPELWGALRGTVHVPPGTDLAAPLDEEWEAAS